MSFKTGFQQYQNYAPPGVRLPKINIDQKYYKKLKIDESISNFDFLKQLCIEGIKQKIYKKRKTNKIISKESMKSLRY